MSRRIQLASLGAARVLAEVRQVLRTGLDSGRMADFLTNVDWANHDRASASVRELLGQLEQWSTEFAEGGIDAAEYSARLTALLPPAERPARTPKRALRSAS